MDDNPKKEGTKDHILKVVSNILASWMNRFMRLIGRCVMLNLVKTRYLFSSFIL